MGVKSTILYFRRNQDNYHFYYDKECGEYLLDYGNDESLKLFLDRIGKILETCPLSDSLLDQENKKYRPVCPILDKNN